MDGVIGRRVVGLATSTRRAITPSMPNTVAVDVFVEGVAGSYRPFIFYSITGGINAENYEPVLVPIPVTTNDRPTPGANGSLWRSDFWVHNRGANPVELFVGGKPRCTLLCSLCCNNLPPPAVQASGTLGGGDFHTPLDSPQLFYIQRGGADDLTFSLRVRDVSRSGENAGTDIPVARERDTRVGSIELLDVPIEEGSRTSLRVYETLGHLVFPITLRIARMDGPVVVEKEVRLESPQPDSGFPFVPVPAFLQIGDLRAELPQLQPGRYRIEVTSNTIDRLWMLATVTNNETQFVTAIAPH